MNDRNVSILENYDFTVLRTWKGRGAILCETNEGVRILREYHGPREKLCYIEAITNGLKEDGFRTDCLIRNKAGELTCKDREQTTYIVKEYFEGRECSVTDVSDCVRAVRQLAAIHNRLRIPLPEHVLPAVIPVETPEMVEAEGELEPQEAAAEAEKPDVPEKPEDKPFRFVMYQPLQEYERYHRELKRILKHLREKSSKTDFEVFLLHNFPFFMEQAAWTIAQIRTIPMESYYLAAAEKGMLCHGDFQYHNILYNGSDTCVMNYEKCMLDLQIRDLYHFFRKIMEKNGWNQEVGAQLLDAYTAIRPLDAFELEQMYLRLQYPEKFRKVVSYYHNSGKSWIPGKSREKLEKLLVQEEAKQRLLERLF